MRRDFKKFPGEFFSTVGMFPKLVEVQHAFNTPRSVLHPTTLPTRCPCCCVHCAQVRPLPLERTRHLFFFFFSRYAKPRALAPSVNSTRCGGPLSHDVPPLPPLPKSAQKRSPLSVQVKAMEL